MNLKDLQKNWDSFGKKDPLWAILTEEDMKGNKWDEEAFFDRGQKWVSRELRLLKRLENKGLQRKSALDFGCGVGRITRALAGEFEQVKGVDIAPSMIEKAREYNAHLNNCEFVLNERSDLKVFANDSFDLVVTVITLQHMKPRYAKEYIKEFLRVLKPGGLIIFQIPSSSSFIYTAPIFKFLNRLRYSIKSDSEPKMEMYGTHISEMCSFLENHYGEIIQIKRNNFSGDSWKSFTYYVTK